MAAFETTRTAPFGAITTLRFVQFFYDAVETLRAWNDQRLTRKELGRLSDRELEDIGLCRGDIEDIVRRIR